MRRDRINYRFHTAVDGHTVQGWYDPKRGMKYYTTCVGCGNGARKRKYIQHRRSCQTHFVKMCEASEKAFQKGTKS
jgi:hypothetical protein